ncbi:MAG: ribokinase [Candidatus Zipacnadales bacterium]
MPSPRILVVGSANMDLVVKTPRMPLGGETLRGDEFRTVRGGKGANQAVACARLGAEVCMLGCVGQDAFGEALIQGLQSDGVDCEYIRRHPSTPTGIAVIIIDAQGENSIVIIPGANGELTAEDVRQIPDFGSFNAVLLQLEVPLSVVQATLAAAREYGVLSILDAGPPTEAARTLLTQVDVLSPNETEARTLLGLPIEEEVDPIAAADRLIAAGARNVALKLGAQGALVAGPDFIESVPAFKVESVDTTGAGDAFTAALAVNMACGKDLVSAARIGAAAGALATTVLGAAPSMPTCDALQRFLAEQGVNW